MKNFPKAEKHLMKMLQLAETHELRFSIAKAHQALGELYLQSKLDIFNSYKKSVDEFDKAMQIYNELEKHQDLSAARAMHAVAKGDPPYIFLFENLASCSMKYKEYIKYCESHDTLFHDIRSCF